MSTVVFDGFGRLGEEMIKQSINRQPQEDRPLLILNPPRKLPNTNPLAWSCRPAAKSVVVTGTRFDDQSKQRLLFTIVKDSLSMIVKELTVGVAGVGNCERVEMRVGEGG